MYLGRSYTAPINISATTVQLDIFEILAGTGRPILLTGFEVGQSSEIGDAQEEMLLLILKRAVGATSGSGGGTSTPQVTQPNDAASTATVETGNTTKLTGGTVTELKRFAWNLRSPYLYLPVPEQRIVFADGTRCVLELATTVNDSVGPIVGHIDFIELV